MGLALVWMDVRGFADAEMGQGESTGVDAGDAVEAALVERLNDPQRTAVTHDAGPLLILAGPGSGKTRVITSRIAYLVSVRGIQPWELLAITFTNKAAREMRERVEVLLPGTKGLWISTFHSMGARILRREIEALGSYTRDFSIYDTSDRNQLIKRVIKQQGFDTTRFRAPALGGWISNAKNGVWGDGESPEELETDGTLEGEVYGKVRRAYVQAMRDNNALDFDDLLLLTLELFEHHPGIRDQYARRFRHVMVDEYQDTNRVQYRITRHLASGHDNLAVCGDPDQSIYAWRGADVRNILDFEQDFGTPTVVKLEQNYRSKGNILKAASALIGYNSERKQKGLWTEADDGARLCVLECGDENDEARELAHQIRGLRAQGGKLSDVAVFYRANFMQRALETALRQSNLAYQVVGGVEFYSRREVRDLISFLRLAINQRDDIAFRRVVNVPARGIGETSLTRLAEFASARGLSLCEAVRLDEALAQIRGRAKKGLAEFGRMLDALEELREVGAAVAIDLVLGAIDREAWMRAMDDGGGTEDREANIDELSTHAAEFDRMHPDAGLRGFLEEIALVSEVDGMEEGAEKVALMTLHAAKGLEFPNVFIVGVEEELLPHARAIAEGGEEEERRLFYVGLTRARERLFLSWARTRLFFGESRWNRPSRFLEEIPEELVEGGTPEMDEEEALGAFEAPASAPDLAVGARVLHPHFGPGKVLTLSGSGINARATVNFDDYGTKQLLLQYANLERA